MEWSQMEERLQNQGDNNWFIPVFCEKHEEAGWKDFTSGGLKKIQKQKQAPKKTAKEKDPSKKPKSSSKKYQSVSHHINLSDNTTFTEVKSVVNQYLERKKQTLQVVPPVLKIAPKSKTITKKNLKKGKTFKAS